MSPVSRMKKTRAKVKTAKLFILEVSTVVGSQVTPPSPGTVSAQLRPCLLPAPDGSHREFLQPQDSPATGRPPLPDRPQQPGEGGPAACPVFQAPACSRPPCPGGLHQRTWTLTPRAPGPPPRPLHFHSMCNRHAAVSSAGNSPPSQTDLPTPQQLRLTGSASLCSCSHTSGVDLSGGPHRAILLPFLPASPSEPPGPSRSPLRPQPGLPGCILVSSPLPTWAPSIPLWESLLFQIKVWWGQVQRVSHLLVLNSTPSRMWPQLTRTFPAMPDPGFLLPHAAFSQACSRAFAFGAFADPEQFHFSAFSQRPRLQGAGTGHGPQGPSGLEPVAGW